MKSASSADSTDASGKRVEGAPDAAVSRSSPDASFDETFRANAPVSPSATRNSAAAVTTVKEQKGWKQASESDAAALGETGEKEPLRIDTPDEIDRSPIRFPTSEHHPKTREEAIRDIAHRRFEERGDGTGSELQDWLDAEAEFDSGAQG